MKKVRPFTAERCRARWVDGCSMGVGHVEKRWEGGTYGSAIWRQAESDRGGAAQVSANKCGGWRRRQGKLNKAFPGAAHIFP